MTLKSCKKGACVRVLEVHTSEELAARLQSLGLSRGASVHILRVSPFRRVWLAETASATFAMGKEIAESVEVSV